MILFPPPITPAAGAALSANNLSDLASAASARANLKVDSTTEVLAKTATRASAPQIISDGATTNRAQVQTGTTRTDISTAPAATYRTIVYVPTSNPSTTNWIHVRAVNATLSTYPNSLGIYIGTAGALIIRAYGTAGAGDYRTFDWSGFRAAYSGQYVILEIYFVNSTTDPVVLANDIDISSSFTAATALTPPSAWLHSDLKNDYMLTGLNWGTGPAPLGCWINGALSAADRTYWRATGLPPKWVVDGGSQAALHTADFSAGVSGWSQNIGDVNLLLSGNVDSIAGQDDNLQVTASGANKNFQIKSGDIFLLTPKKFVVTFDYYCEASSGLAYLGFGVSGTRYDDGGVAVVEGAWTSARFVVTNYTPAYLRISGFTTESGTTVDVLLSGVSIYFRNVVVKQIGALSLPVQGPDGYVLDGTRQTPANIATLTGMQWNNPVPVGTRLGITKTLAHGDISATAATTLALTLPAGWAIREVQRNVTTAFDAGRTYNLGISGTPTKFINAADLVTTGFAATASSVTVPQSATASTSIYIQKSGATTQGEVRLNFIVEKIF